MNRKAACRMGGARAHLPLRGLLALIAVLVGGAHAHGQSQGPAAAPQRELIAVLDLQAVGASEVEASALTDRLREELFKTGRFRLIDRSQLESVMAEQALQQAGCTEEECAVQVGRVLGVRKIVAGKLTRISPTVWQLSTLMVDVETTETLAAESIQHRGDFFDLLTVRVPPLAARLAGTSSEAVPPAAVAPVEPAPAGEPPAAAPEPPSRTVYRLFATPISVQSVTLDETGLVPGGRKEVVSSTGLALGAHIRFPSRWGARFVLHTATVQETTLDEQAVPATGTLTSITLAADYGWEYTHWSFSVGGGIYSATATYTPQDAQLDPSGAELELGASGLALVGSVLYRFNNNLIAGADVAGGLTGEASGSRVEGRTIPPDAKRPVTGGRISLLVGYQFGGGASPGDAAPAN